MRDTEFNRWAVRSIAALTLLALAAFVTGSAFGLGFKLVAGW